MKQNATYEQRFTTHGVFIGEQAIELGNLETDEERIHTIHPGIFGSSWGQTNHTRLITGHVIHEQYSYPITQDYVGYQVGFLTDRLGGKDILNYIYCLKKPEIIKKLIDWLSTINVKNSSDLTEAHEYLLNLYFSLTQK